MGSYNAPIGTAGGAFNVNIDSSSVPDGKVQDMLAAMTACTASDCANRAQWTAQTAGIRTAQQALLLVAGTVGIVKQWETLDRQTDINQEAVNQAREYLELAQDNYTDVTLRAFECNKLLFDHYVDVHEAKGDAFVTFAEEDRAFTPDCPTAQSRAVGVARNAFTETSLAHRRVTSRYAGGMRAELVHRNRVRQALAETHAANVGFRYEDERYMMWDKYHFDRRRAGAAFIEAMRSHVISGINQGTANATSGVGMVGSGIASLGSVTSSMADALSNKASFYGNLSNQAFGALGSMNERYGSMLDTWSNANGSRTRSAQAMGAYDIYDAGVYPPQGNF